MIGYHYSFFNAQFHFPKLQALQAFESFDIIFSTKVLPLQGSLEIFLLSKEYFESNDEFFIIKKPQPLILENNFQY